MKQHMKPNQFECNQQWQHQSKCECHQQITQCQFIDKKFEAKVVKEHEFVHTKHKTSFFYNEYKKHSKQCHEKQFIHSHEQDKKSRSPLNIKVDHKCIESKRKIKNEGSPTWWKKKKKKKKNHMKLNKKMEWPSKHTYTLKRAQDF